MVEAIRPLLERPLVLVAHPDDETMGAGVLLQRARKPLVVFATDGAPRDRYFWEKYGSREAYAMVRRREAAAALEVARIRESHFLAAEGASTRFVDQDLFLWIPQAMEALEELIAREHPKALLSHAYEGGHPDHDACSFLAAMLGRRHELPVWEFPLYHRSTDGVIVRQEFMSALGTEVLMDSTVDEVETKKRMVAVYTSQAHVMAEFVPSIERFRPLAPYDFSQPPHNGVLNYEAWRWPVTGAQVVSAFQCWIGSQKPQDIVPSEPGVRTVA